MKHVLVWALKIDIKIYPAGSYPIDNANPKGSSFTTKTRFKITSDWRFKAGYMRTLRIYDL